MTVLLLVTIMHHPIFASYMNNTPKVVWIRGDMSELNYNNFGLTG